MRRHLCKYLLLILFLIWKNPAEVIAQDIQLSQFYAAPTYLNPAFAGANVCARLSSTIRNQWPGLPHGYISEIVSFDHYFNAQGVGVGFLFTNDVAGTGRLKSTSFSGLIAYEFLISRQLGIRFGMQFGGGTRSLNFNNLIFGDQLATGGPTIEAPVETKGFFDISTGTLAFGKKYWAGMSIHHITQPNESLLADEAFLPRKFSLHGGYKFLAMGEEDDEEHAHFIIPTINYKAQAKFDQLDVGAYYLHNKFTCGLWYRGIPGFKAYKKGYPNNDALVFLLGLKIDRLSMGYSYDFTISWLRGSTAGAHEFSLSYQFCKLKKRRRKAPLIACPKF
jgi:type IX secretion system PorP/SprF family membrane protein